jgi:hypothetical protein
MKTVKTLQKQLDQLQAKETVIQSKIKNLQNELVIAQEREIRMVIAKNYPMSTVEVKKLADKYNYSLKTFMLKFLNSSFSNSSPSSDSRCYGSMRAKPSACGCADCS